MIAIDNNSHVIDLVISSVVKNLTKYVMLFRILSLLTLLHYIGFLIIDK